MKKKKFSPDEEWTGSPESIFYKPGTGTLFAILGVCAVLTIAAGFFFWYVPSVGLKNIHPLLPYVSGVIIFTISIFMLAGIFTVIISIVTGREVLQFPMFRWFLIRLFLPLMALLGGVLKMPRIEIERAFIDLNNKVVKGMVKRGRRFSPERILILMPHCIQWDDCKIKVTRDVKNCVGCGRCEIGELVTLTEKYALNLFVLTGGTVARRKVSEYRPDAVVAVACERDLTSGVQDAYPLPVMAIVNKRPRGYCVETGVAVEEVKAAIEELLGAVST